MAKKKNKTHDLYDLYLCKECKRLYWFRKCDDISCERCVMDKENDLDIGDADMEKIKGGVRLSEFEYLRYKIMQESMIWIYNDLDTVNKTIKEIEGRIKNREKEVDRILNNTYSLREKIENIGFYERLVEELKGVPGAW